MLDLSNTSLSDLTSTSLPSYARLDMLPSLPILSLEKADMAPVYSFIADMWTLSTVWKLLVIVAITANFKNFPLIYHLRLLNAVRFVLKSQRSKEGPTPQQLFQPIITSSKTSLLETDCYLHKSNSTYFSDVDVARAHLITTLFSKGIEKIRGGTTAMVKGKVPPFGVALGAVSCTFRRELKPYETYDMWTRVLAWDDKWCYMVTHFVKKGAKVSPKEFSLYPRQNSVAGSTFASPRGSVDDSATPRGSISSLHASPTPEGKSAIAASALSKLVFKNGRITISPKVMLEASGLLPPEPKKDELEHDADLAEAQIQANIGHAAPQKSMQTLDQLSSSDSDSDSECDQQISDWTWSRIEEERKRGLKIANLLGGLNVLENEFNDQEALGRHTDGSGIPGCVATLAQLGGMSRYQLL